MAYVECKIWPFSDKISHQETRYKAMKLGHEHHAVKALIDTSSSENFISKNLANKLEEKYGNNYKNQRVKNSLGTIRCLDLSFRYKGKERLVSKSDTGLNDFEVVKDRYLKANLILGIPWLWLREAKTDMKKKGKREKHILN